MTCRSWPIISSNGFVLRETGRAQFAVFTPEGDAENGTIPVAWQCPRKLRNVVERAVALGRGPMLDVGDIWLSSLEVGGAPQSETGPEKYEPMSIEEIEKRYILQTLEHTDWNKSQAAAILQIERSTLDRKIKGYNLKRDE